MEWEEYRRMARAMREAGIRIGSIDVLCGDCERWQRIDWYAKRWVGRRTRPRKARDERHCRFCGAELRVAERFGKPPKGENVGG